MIAWSASFWAFSAVQPGVSNSFAIDPFTNRLWVAATAPDAADGNVDGVSELGAYYGIDVVPSGFGYDLSIACSRYFAGGSPGEVGGSFWRSGPYCYYADRVGPLSLDDSLEASGKVVLKVGAPDSDMFLGWFSSANREKPPVEAGNFLGVHVGGPTRVGHYFHPSLATAKGTRAQAATGPVLAPGKVHQWTLVYDPAAEGGNGAVTVTLDAEAVTFPLRKGVKAQGARFDRFGMLTTNIGGRSTSDSPR